MMKLQAGLNGLLEKYVLLAVFLFPITIVLVKSGGTTIFGITAILSLVIFFKKAVKQVFSREEKLFFYSCVLIFLMAMFVSLLGGFDKDAWKPVSRMLNLLLAVPLYFLFKQYLRKENIIWWGLFIAVVLCGAVAIYEVGFGSLYGSGAVGRIGASTNPILFGNISLSMMAMLVVAATTVKKMNYKVMLMVLVIIFFGLAATLLSHSRGGWLMLPVLIVIIAWQLKSKISAKSLSLVVLMVPLIAVIMYMVPATGIQDRIDRSFDNIQKYSQGTGKTTSIGIRLEMWKASWLLFEQQPVAGVGWGNYQENVRKLIEQKKASPKTDTWGSPHSQYFSAIVAGGSLMLFALVVFFLVPIFRFKRLLAFNDARVKSYALAGIVLIIGYMIYGLTESIFERSIPTGFFAFYLALLFAMANRIKEQKAIKGIKREKKLSVILIAYNEVDRIEKCLLSVYGWADEIVVFDNGSADGTIEIAKKYTDKVFVTDWPGYGKQKQRALNEAQFEWVLSIDADEQLTSELRAEIDSIVSSGNDEIAYRIPWAVTIYNKRLDFGRSGRAPLRLFKREGARFSEASVHEKVLLPAGKVGRLQERLLHFTHRDLKHAMDKFNQYAWLWATERFKKGKRASMLSAIAHGSWTFIVAFFFRLGFLDGYRGFLMAVHISLYSFNKYAALWTLELQHNK